MELVVVAAVVLAAPVVLAIIVTSPPQPLPVAAAALLDQAPFRLKVVTAGLEEQLLRELAAQETFPVAVAAVL